MDREELNRIAMQHLAERKAETARRRQQTRWIGIFFAVLIVGQLVALILTETGVW